MPADVIPWGAPMGTGKGELRHYSYRSYGYFKWPCPCGHKVEIRLNKSGKRFSVDKNVNIEFFHRSAERTYSAKEPDAYQILKRFKAVLAFKHCRVPWE